MRTSARRQTFRPKDKPWIDHVLVKETVKGWSCEMLVFGPSAVHGTIQNSTSQWFPKSRAPGSSGDPGLIAEHFMKTPNVMLLRDWFNGCCVVTAFRNSSLTKGEREEINKKLSAKYGVKWAWTSRIAQSKAANILAAIKMKIDERYSPTF